MEYHKIGLLFCKNCFLNTSFSAREEQASVLLPFVSFAVFLNCWCKVGRLVQKNKFTRSFSDGSFNVCLPFCDNWTTTIAPRQISD